MLGNGKECGKTKVKRISWEPSPLQIMMDQKHFNYLSSMIINYAKCISKIKAKIFITKAEFDRKKTFSQSNST
jgi:hypothetical protein